MTWRLIWTREGLEDLRKLDPPIAQAVREALTRLAETGAGRLKRLKPPLKGHRLRVRDWRVVLYMDNAAGTITVRHIEHRSQVYQRR